MTRDTCREIIAFAFYKRREEMRSQGVEPYGNSDTDQMSAELVIKFFKDDPGLGYKYAHRYDDYRMFKGLVEEIE